MSTGTFRPRRAERDPGEHAELEAAHRSQDAHGPPTRGSGRIRV